MSPGKVKFALDTNAVIALLKKEVGLIAWLRRHDPGDFGLPAVVMHEMFYGALKSRRREENLGHLRLLPFEVLQFDAEDARVAGQIRVELEQRGSPIGPYDLLIAGQALSRGLTLVTRNTREFSRVPRLQIVEGR